MADHTVSAAIDTFLTDGPLTLSVAGAANTPALRLSGTTFNGGDTTTNKPHFLIEPTGAISLLWHLGGTLLGVNANSGFNGNLIDAKLNGTSMFRVLYDGSISNPGNAFFVTTTYLGLGTAMLLSWTNSSSGGGTKTTTLAQLGVANLRLGNVPSAAPIAQTLTIGEASRPGTDSNVAGANGTVESALGTGTGTPSSLIFRTPGVAGAGSGVQAQVTRLTLNSSGMQIPSSPPASAAATGVAGTIAWDAGFIYVCTAANTWKRAALSSW